MILLTGVNGFIGKHVLDILLKFYKEEDIIVLSSTKHFFLKTILYSDGLYATSNLHVNTDLLDHVSYIIHAGAFTPKSGREANNIHDAESNIINSSYILNLKCNNLKKIIFLSTLDVYDINGIVSECTDTKPSTLYGWSKLYCEEVLKSYCNTNAVNYQILRVGHVFGPGEDAYQKIIPLSFQRILNNEIIEIYGEGNELRNFVYVEDVAIAIVTALKLDLKDKIINIVGSESISIKSLIEMILKITKSSVDVKHTNLDFKGKDYKFDNTVFVNNYKPHYTSLEDGLMKEWYYLKTNE